MTGIINSFKSPTLPSPTEDTALSCLRLLRSRRVGPATYKRLIREHGSADAALAALPDIAADAGVAGYAICPEAVVIAELKSARANYARLLIAGHAGYPTVLDDLDDAPPLLWAMGDTDLISRPVIALVGARNASSLGLRMAKKLAADLGATGYVIMSGLARGVDTAAHTASLSTGTIAVQAGGVDTVYPNENNALAQDIAKTGLRISEMPMGVQPQAHHFPARNQIISGMARGVIVIEALGPIAQPAPAPAPVSQPRSLRAVAGLHAEILQCLGPSPVAEDQLIRDLGAAPTAAAPALVSLELDGRIRRQRGGLLSLAE